jgi:hypothetical protein
VRIIVVVFDCGNESQFFFLLLFPHARTWNAATTDDYVDDNDDDDVDDDDEHGRITYLAAIYNTRNIVCACARARPV